MSTVAGMGEGAGSGDGVADRLARFLADAVGRPGLQVEGWHRLAGGASRETFAFETRLGEATERLVVQRVRAGALSESFSMESEARLLRAAASAGVPVAPVVAASDDRGVVGSPFVVLGWVDGETIGRRILRDDEFAPARRRFVVDAARALAAIHRIPLEEAPGLRHQDVLGEIRGLYDHLGQAHPTFELALRWLDEHRPPPGADGVVHGDFRLGNLMVGPEGLRAVLDWELAHRGDPMEDLGWLCARAWRFGAPAPVAGMGGYDELFAAYGEAAGVEVDAEAVRWWEVFGTLRWGVICILQAETHRSGMSRSVELAAIGRRVCETEHDLLVLLAPGLVSSAAPPVGASVPPSRPVAGTPPTGPHDAPDAVELLDAVGEFLERDVMPATSGRVQFHARVAARVVSMVARELALGPALTEDHRARLDGLGMADDAELAAAIRAGALDDRRDEVLAVVRAAVDDKLRVANPDYA